jgi:peptide/nickel transport system substrate-binding protein
MRLVLMLSAVVALLAGPALAQKSGGTLRVSHRDNPPSASIHEEATISTVMPFMSVYNNLVVFDPDSKQNRPDKIVPDLATEWAWSADGNDLTFKLRDGVKWHDGKPFTSADVKCTWGMLLGGLSRWLTRKVPPDFCAKAGPARRATTVDSINTRRMTFPPILFCLRSR